MQFVKNGPDIPIELLHLHEEGELVFFCGAGISFPAGLCGFRELTRKSIDKFNCSNSATKSAFKQKKYDEALGLLERSYQGKRAKIRNFIGDLLSNVDYRKSDAKTYHSSLLTLAKSRKGQLRLVTTNFDRIFEDLKETKEFSAIQSYKAPLLPTVKEAKWDGLVYLHGLLPKDKSDTSSLNNLVLTSGDFGQAYLQERWAAKFVTDLFKKYTVCFVGYSLNDPILRYMVDALAVDESLGEKTRKHYVFADYSTKKDKKGKVDKKKEKGTVQVEWEAKNVTPILYDDENNHKYLIDTFKAWAETYSNGLNGRQNIIKSCASAKPTAGVVDDFYAQQMLWALSDKTGNAAKYFSKITPTPPIEWLDVFDYKGYSFTQLHIFGVNINIPAKDKNEKFSFINRPNASLDNPWMSLLRNTASTVSLDTYLSYIAEWLLKYLSHPSLIRWIIKNRGGLHPSFKIAIKNRLDKISKMKDADREALLKEAPYAIPQGEFKQIWKYILNGLTDITCDRNTAICLSDISQKKDFEDGISFIFKKKLRISLSVRVKIQVYNYIFKLVFNLIPIFRGTIPVINIFSGRNS